MPLYTYECDQCGRQMDEHRIIADRYRPARCECGHFAYRGIEAPRINPDLEPYFDHNLAPMWSNKPGTWVGSRRERRDLVRNLGVVESG